MLSSFLAAAGLLALQPAMASPDYLERQDVRSFIDSVHENHGISISELERVMGAVRYQPTVVRLTTPVPSSAPSPARSYKDYREKFLTPELISAGTRFWMENAAHLERMDRGPAEAA